MKMRLAAAAFLLVVCAGLRGNLFACGDKFLVVSRATRYKHQPPGDVDDKPEYGIQHDRLLRNNFHAGVGFVYQLPCVDIYTSYIGFANGPDTHKGRAFSVGISWPFELGGGRQAP